MSRMQHQQSVPAHKLKDKIFPDTMMSQLPTHGQHRLVRWYITTITFLVEEHSDRQPRVAADLKSGLDVTQLIHLFFAQLPSVELEIPLDTRLSDGFGDDAGTSLLNVYHVSLGCSDFTVGIE